MRILITGATGFIGSRFVLRCLSKQYSVRAFGQENNAAELENRRLLEKKGAEVVIGSVTDRENVFKICSGIDWVFHLAAAQHEANVPDQHFWDVNVNGTKNLLDGSVEAGVRRFVHGSTIGVYGESLEGNIDESFPLKPKNIYGVTKLEAEKLVQSYKSKLPTVILRISETYGPADRRLLKLFKAIKKNVFFMIGRGDNLHHLIFIDDLIEGFFQSAELDEAVGNIFILAGTKPLTSNEMVNEIAQIFNTKIPKLKLPLFLILSMACILEGILRPLGIQPPLHRRRIDFFRKSFYFSQEHAQKKLKFEPKIDFSEGVRKTAKWYQEMNLL